MTGNESPAGKDGASQGSREAQGQDTPTRAATANPFEAATQYRAAGWEGTIQIPLGKKSPPPPGFTGTGGLWPSSADVHAWGEDGPRNIGLRYPTNVIGADVDDHVKFATLVATIGPLPATWRIVSGSGRYGTALYRLPDDAPSDDMTAPVESGMDLIRHGHRYSVAWPSVHPSGSQYVWVNPHGTVVDGHIPGPNDLTELPAAWVAALRTTSSGFGWGQSKQGKAGVLGEPITSNHDDVLAAYVASLVRRGAREEEARELVQVRIRDVTGGDPTNPFTVRDFDRWWSGAAKKYTPHRAGTNNSPDPAAGEAEERRNGTRRVGLTPASSIAMRPTKWLWTARIPLHALALLAGREGIGKSTAAYQLAADITRGLLPGAFFGQPRAVIVAATEDSWEHTIVPRLTAASADLTMVYRVDVTTAAGFDATLILPADLGQVGEAITATGAALLLLDPLMSRLDSGLDTHRDADVRRALEPLVAVADKCGATVLGIIHVNKSSGEDALTRLMGSRAFAAVARAVLFVMSDPDDAKTRLLGQAKNNLGRCDLPTLMFQIESVTVAHTEEGPIESSRIVWTGETTRTLSDALDDADDRGDVRTAVDEAGDWLDDWLASKGGTDESANVKKAGAAAGHNVEAIKRARRKQKLTTTSAGFPRRTYWSIPGTQPAQQSGHAVGSTYGESVLTDLTDLTEGPGTWSGQSGQSGQSEQSPSGETQLAAASTPTCAVCGEPLAPWLTANGYTEHVNCAPGAA